MQRPKLTIALQIRAGFAALVLLGLVVSLLSVQREQQAGGRVTLLSDLSRQKNRITTASLALDRLELAETNFRLSGGASQKAESLAAMEAANAAIADLHDTARQDSDRSQIAALQTQLAQHGEQQADFFRLAGATQSAADQLSATGAAINNAGNELVAAVDGDTESTSAAAANIISRRLMQMQIVSLQFQTRRNAESARTFDNTARNVQTIIDSARQTLGPAAAELPPVEALLTEYRVQFKAWSEAGIAADRLYNGALRPGIGQLQESLRQMDTGFTEQFRQAREAAAQQSQRGMITGLVVAGLALLIGVGLAVLIVRRIIPPLASSTETMRRMAEGDHTTRIRHTARADEIGAMARTLEVFRANALRAEALAAKELEAQAAQRARNERLERQIKQFDAGIAAATQGLTQVAARMESTAGDLAATAAQTTQQSSQVLGAAQDTSQSVQNVAGSTEQLASSIQEISRQVMQSTAVAQRAVEGARKTDVTVQALATGAQKIGEVVELISSIAGQTNLLALNATIEAARAGEAGKGFAVVASEVKSLATATARATDDIASQITAIQTATRNAVEEIGQIAAIITEINQIGTAIAAAVEQQGTATALIARNVEMAASSTDHVSHLIVDVREAARRTGSAAEDMHAVSTDVAGQANAMITQIARFTAEVKAA